MDETSDTGLIDLQNRIVVTIASSITRAWDAAVVNIEIDHFDGEQTENCLAFSFELERGKWKRSSFQLPFTCYDLFSTLRNSSSGERWCSCTLEFESNGKYTCSSHTILQSFLAAFTMTKQC